MCGNARQLVLGGTKIGKPRQPSLDFGRRVHILRDGVSREEGGVHILGDGVSRNGSGVSGLKVGSVRHKA